MSRRSLLRLAAVLGAVGVGAFLVRAAPREVDLVYDVSRVRGAGALEVEIRRGADLVRRAEFRLAAGATSVRHAVRLPDGEYAITWRVEADGGPVRGSRALEVREGGTIVLPLGP